ncbi:5-formyltetrahydrofolate cyclo-ligase [Rhodohalobacter halophilus]|uniref:5-formyltetrahydrofolate cyclo-ligase n=1 Tax=Rhodohalobacter halophilus TaxID=1812810 RepID=UPI00083F97D1|nr:5-formyltetrahydrofolate cyclo-ligase [Rhodohalobacter halophilus]
MSHPNLSEQKKEVRKKYHSIRSNLTKDYMVEANRVIYDRIINLKEYRKANTIHIFTSMTDRNEVDTYPLIEYSFEIGKQVIVPVMKENGILIHSEIHSLKDLHTNDWGVPEPITVHEVQAQDIDIVFVPMLAGDVKRNRIGYGKGYYDRFLKEISAPKIGLLFDVQISDTLLPTGKHDVQLDKLITNSRIIE